MPNEDTSSEPIAELVLDPGTACAADERRRVKWKALIGRTADVETADCTIWSGNTRDVDALKSARGYKELMSSVAAVGQQVPVIARICQADPSKIEIVAGASRYSAICDLNEDGRDEALKLRVEIRSMDDKEAFALVQAENHGRSQFSAIERARFFKAAIDREYETQDKLAKELGIHKSNVSRTLAILELPECVTALIDNEHQISATAVDAFMSNWRDDTLRLTIQAAVDAWDPDQKGATFVLKTLTALADVPSPPPIDVSVADQKIGTLRRQKGGGIIIELDASAGPAGSKSVAQAIGVALRKLGNSKA